MDLNREDLLLGNLVNKNQEEEEQAVIDLEKKIEEERDKELKKFNFKIQFREPTWVLVEDIHGTFAGPNSKVMALQTTSEPFGVLRVIRDKKRNCCTIIVRGDYRRKDGHYECRMINVPNKLFKEVQ
jgi:hypothetical protein